MSKDNKVLLVTGASSDVGRTLIEKVGDNYSIIWAHYNTSKDSLSGLCEKYKNKVIPVQADFTNTDSVKAMAETIKASGSLPDHIVHLSAPRPENKHFYKTEPESFSENLSTSVTSISLLLKEFIPAMRKAKYGKIVFMLTSYVLGVPPKFLSPYITSKYALLGLMKSLASEYAGNGITVNGVSPDMMETAFLKNLADLVIEDNASKSPLGRNLTPADVVPTFEYLLSDGADTVNGANIAITAGVR